jgi:hypothetical protein
MLNLVSGRRTLGGADGDDERQNGRNSFFLFPGGGESSSDAFKWINM